MDTTSFAQRVADYLANAGNRQTLKVMIALLGVSLLFFSPLVDLRALRRRGVLGVLLALLLVAALAVSAYFEFGWKRYGRYMNPHDVFHYYVGAKYSAEHEYFNLYRCAYLADQEMNREFRESAIRNLETHAMEPVSAVAASAVAYKAPFTPARWEEFKRDIAYFQACVRTEPGKWTRMLRDKGYNATPVWNAVARWLAERAPAPRAEFQVLRDELHALGEMRGVPGAAAAPLWQRVALAVAQCRQALDADDPALAGNRQALELLEAEIEQLRTWSGSAMAGDAAAARARIASLVDRADPGSPWPMRLLTYIDLALLGLMFLALWAAFGWRVMLLALIFYGTSFFMNFVHIKGAFMRLDWLALLVVAMCLLKRGWHGAAGGVMAYACMARIFPFIFVFGMGARLVWHVLGWLWDRLRGAVAPRMFEFGYARFFLALAVVSGALVGMTYHADGGMKLWRVFGGKIAVHNADYSTTRVGFKYAVLGAHRRANAGETGWARAKPVFERAESLHGQVETARTAPADQPAWARTLARIIPQRESRGGIDALWQRLSLLNYAAAGLALLLVFLACAKLEDYEAVALGFVAAYFLAAPTFYYYVMLLAPLLFFLPKLTLTSRALGAALFFFFSIACYFVVWLYPGDREWERQHFIISCLMLAPCAWLLLSALAAPRRPRLAVVASADPYAALTAAAAPAARAERGLPPPRERADGRLERLGPGGMETGEPPQPAPALSEAPTAPARKRSPWVDFVVWALLGALVGLGGLFAMRHFILEPAAAPAPPAETVEAPSATALPEADSAPARELPPGQIEIVLTGDVMLSRNVARSIEQGNRNFAYPFEAAAPYLRGAHLAFCNLESPISGRGEALQKTYTFNAPPRAIEGLVYAGFDVVSLANNHTLDFGPVALEDTLRLLADQGIRAVGVSENDAPQEPAILEAGGLRVGFLAYCDPETPYACAREFDVFDTRPAEGTREAIARDIAALRPRVDILVVSMHWGVEYTPAPNAHTVALGRFIIDEGAHIVAGHHPHVQHEPELYNGGLILYSMGNFVFDQWSRPATTESRLYRVVVDRQGVVSADYLPMTIPRHEWKPTPTQDAFIPVEPGAPAQDEAVQDEAAETGAGEQP